MKYVYFVFFSFVVSFSRAQCVQGDAGMLHNQGVGFSLTTSGVFWQYGNGAGYEVPLNSGLHTIFSGSVWLAAYGNDSVFMSTQKFLSNPTELFPGPIDQSTGQPLDCDLFDRFFTVSKEDVQNHIAGIATSDNILKWPARGSDFVGGVNQTLAPFVDVNNDGIYRPEDGDYPEIKGDYNIWFVLNDKGGEHLNSLTDPIGMELQFMVYGFLNDLSFINDVFHDVKLINRSTRNYDSVVVGLNVDFDIGSGYDDFVGCDSARNMFYALNGDHFDDNYGQNPPYQAFVFKNFIGVGGMTGFVGYTSMGNNYHTDPTTPSDYLNFLNHRWKDGSPMVKGGSGHFSSGNFPSSRFLFNFHQETNTGWTQCSSTLFPTDMRALATVGNFGMNSQDEVGFSFVSVYYRPDVFTDCLLESSFLDHIDEVIDNPPVLGVDKLNETESVIYPNPCLNEVTIKSEVPFEKVTLYDQLGRNVLEKLNCTKLDLSGLPAGVYHLHLENRESALQQKLIKR